MAVALFQKKKDDKIKTKKSILDHIKERHPRNMLTLVSMDGAVLGIRMHPPIQPMKHLAVS